MVYIYNNHFLISWKLTSKIREFISLLLLLIDLGLWSFMNETLSIVIASVLISLALGFP